MRATIKTTLKVIKESNENLYENTRPCVRSGMCCKHGICPFGKWDETKHQCEYLEIEGVYDGQEIHRCGKFAEINSDHRSEFSPAFGAGCCSPLGNTARNKIVHSINAKRISLTVVDGSRTTVSLPIR